jgi:cell division protein FtsI (penicillin-binding protein 3)
VRRAVAPWIAKRLKAAFVRVVEDDEIGTGRLARIEGIKIAGKTGTAQKVDPETGLYSSTKVVASFVGFFPADDPRYLIYVVINEPMRGKYGGTVAAPLFKRIAMDILMMEGIELKEGPA